MAVLQRRSGGLIGFDLHATEAADSVQRTTLRGGNDYPLRPLVPAVPAQLAATGRDHGRAKPERGSRDDLALGPAVCAGTEPTLPTGAPEHDRSWRVDETYCRVAGKWTYLYRAVDSTGATIDFLLSANRDAAAAKRFLQKALRSPGHPRPRVINVDGNPSYPKVITELKQTGELGRHCLYRPVRYLNNIVEQDHRAIKRRVRACQGFRAFHSAWRTLQGIETMNMIRKGQVRWLPKNDIAGLGRVRRTTVWADDGVIAGPTASYSRSRFCTGNTALLAPSSSAPFPRLG